MFQIESILEMHNARIFAEDRAELGRQKPGFAFKRRIRPAGEILMQELMRLFHRGVELICLKTRIRRDMNADHAPALCFEQFILQFTQPEEPGLHLADGPESAVKPVPSIGYAMLFYKTREAFHGIQPHRFRQILPRSLFTVDQRFLQMTAKLCRSVVLFIGCLRFAEHAVAHTDHEGFRHADGLHKPFRTVGARTAVFPPDHLLELFRVHKLP